LGGGLTAGFVLRGSQVLPTLAVSITSNNLQIGKPDSYAILEVTETNKKQ
jgi:hypothetical protein